jgi:tetratricopeptide (TPR) repeat protein
MGITTWAITVTIERLSREDQPGWVVCTFVDASGRRHVFEEKVPVVTYDNLDASSAYPCAGVIGCEFIDHRQTADGRQLFTVDTEVAWGIESTAGETRFAVFREQLVPLTPPAMTTEGILKYWQATAARQRDGDDKLTAVLGVAACLARLGRHEEVLAELDGATLVQPSPAAMLIWLNNRAYALTLLNRAGEALPLLDDADLLADDSTAWGLSVSACVVGTRGMTLLHLDRLEDAERLLLRALEIGRDAVALENEPSGPVAVAEQQNLAERWYWLAEVARRQDRASEARERLRRAAAAEGPFAARAAVLLTTG